MILGGDRMHRKELSLRQKQLSEVFFKILKNFQENDYVGVSF